MVGKTTVISLSEKRILESNIEELDMDIIADQIHINGLESCIKTGVYEL